MVPRWQFWRLRSLAKRGSTCCRLDAPRLHPPSLLLNSTPRVPDASRAPSTTIARACRWRPDAVAPIRPPAPRGRCSRPTEGILDHLDALYALAYLNSGDPEGAQQAVISAFIDVCQDPNLTHTCRPRLWRALAGHVHRANEGRQALSAAEPGPFRAGALSPHQQEAIALLLGGRHEREAARLLGISVNMFRRYVRAGLEAVHATTAAELRSRHALAAAREHQSPQKAYDHGGDNR